MREEGKQLLMRKEEVDTEGRMEGLGVQVGRESVGRNSRESVEINVKREEGMSEEYRPEEKCGQMGLL